MYGRTERKANALVVLLGLIVDEPDKVLDHVLPRHDLLYETCR